MRLALCVVCVPLDWAYAKDFWCVVCVSASYDSYSNVSQAVYTSVLIKLFMNLNELLPV